MKAEVVPSQRRLVGLRLHVGSAEYVTKYVFPFVEDSWAVPFYVVDAMTLGPRILRGRLELRSGALHTLDADARLEPLTALPTARFSEVVHFDPWWAFKGIAGLERAWVEAVLASNVATTFNHEGFTYKIHDFAFDTSLQTLDTLVAKDPVFRTVSFRKGDLSLLGLRKPPRT